MQEEWKLSHHNADVFFSELEELSCKRTLIA